MSTTITCHTIVFTGGGSAGHVTPNFPLIRRCLNQGWNVFYIGSEHGIEKSLIEKENVPFLAIASGKLRRYFSWQNFIDPLKILTGIAQAISILRKLKPNLIFSKGGFVSFPVVIAGKILGIPCILHESDLTPGLANRLCFPMAEKICLTFTQTLDFIPKYRQKSITVGMIIRDEAHEGNADEGRKICHFPTDKKIIFVYAGSQGSQKINEILRAALPTLLENFYIIHCCGKGKVDTANKLSGYLQFEYLHETFYHLLACADLVISRSGSNTLSELLMFQKPHILIPLPQQASRGEQIFNARHFELRGTSIVLTESQLDKDTLTKAVNQTMEQAEALKTAMQAHNLPNGTDTVFELIKATLK